MLSKGLILYCFFRTISIGAVTSSRGQQNLGFLHALEPALSRLYKDSEDLARARKRHLTYIITHPHMAPLLIGVLLHMECLIARKAFTPEAMSGIKESMSTSLSAVGDSFFSGSLWPFWAISTSILVMFGLVNLAAAFTLALLLMILAFRIGTFFLGFRQGLSALRFVRYIDLINWGDRLKIVNGCLLALLICKFAFPEALAWRLGGVVFAFVVPVAAALPVSRAQFVRVLLFLSLLIILQTIAWLGLDFWDVP